MCRHNSFSEKNVGRASEIIICSRNRIVVIRIRVVLVISLLPEFSEKMIYELGFENCGLVWKALLGASVTCGDIKIAEVAAAKVIELEGDNEFVYVLMSNMYALHRKWIDVGGTREQMKERKVRKEAGWSWIMGLSLEK